VTTIHTDKLFGLILHKPEVAPSRAYNTGIPVIFSGIKIPVFIKIPFFGTNFEK
jgi:hypothetical protein